MSIEVVRRILNNIKAAVKNRVLEKDSLFLDEVQNCLNFCRSELARGRTEYEDAKLVFEIVLLMQSFRPSLFDDGTLGVETFIADALNALEIPGRRVEMHIAC